jgi:hypothetical protein
MELYYLLKEHERESGIKQYYRQREIIENEYDIIETEFLDEYDYSEDIFPEYTNHIINDLNYNTDVTVYENTN